MSTKLQNREQQPSKAEFQPTSAWSEAARTIEDFHNNPAFVESLYQSGIDPAHPDDPNYSEALAVFAESYCETYAADGLLDFDTAAQIQLLANAPTFFNTYGNVANYEADRRDRRLSNEEWQHYNHSKEYLVWFNQKLSEYIYTHPDGKLSELNRALTEQLVQISPDSAESIEQAITNVARGARTEAVARHLLDLTPVEYSPGTLQDDLRGGDFVIEYSGRRIKVDIKSSLSQVEYVRNKNGDDIDKPYGYAISKHNRDNNNVEKHVVVLFAGFTDNDLGDNLSLQLPPDEVQQRADYMAIQLQRALHELKL